MFLRVLLTQPTRYTNIELVFSGMNVTSFPIKIAKMSSYMIEFFDDAREDVSAIDVMIKFSTLPAGSPERAAVHKFLSSEGAGCSIAEARFFINFLKTIRKFDVFLRQECLEPGLPLRKACVGLFNDLFSFGLSEVFLKDFAARPIIGSRLVRGTSRSEIV